MVCIICFYCRRWLISFFRHSFPRCNLIFKRNLWNSRNRRRRRRKKNTLKETETIILPCACWRYQLIPLWLTLCHIHIVHSDRCEVWAHCIYIQCDHAIMRYRLRVVWVNSLNLSSARLVFVHGDNSWTNPETRLWNVQNIELVCGLCIERKYSDIVTANRYRMKNIYSHIFWQLYFMSQMFNARWQLKVQELSDWVWCDGRRNIRVHR